MMINVITLKRFLIQSSPAEVAGHFGIRSRLMSIKRL